MVVTKAVQWVDWKADHLAVVTVVTMVVTKAGQ